MRPSSARPIHVLVFAAAAVVACDDAPTAPSVLVVAAETEAALRVAADLPTVSQMVDRLVHEVEATSPRDAEALRRARLLWVDAGAAADAADAASLRRAAYAAAAPPISTALDSAELEQVRSSLGRWISLANPVVGAADIPGFAAALADGRRLLQRAEALLRIGRRDDAVIEMLRAADRLSETTPSAVARRLVREIEARLDAEGDGPNGMDGVDRRRVERLARGARQALDDGDYIRAIRRAYYARQLLTLR